VKMGLIERSSCIFSKNIDHFEKSIEYFEKASEVIEKEQGRSKYL